MPVARSLVPGAALALSILAGSAPAIAQPTDGKALARQLFDQGRELAKDEKWAEACPKFEASLRYDAAVGTRLNLATCYEKTGKLASAWALFRESEAAARRAGDTVRQEYAAKQAAALLPRLPRLTIAGPMTPPPGFTVKRDDIVLDVAMLGTGLYVDPGPHEVTASAPGFEPFKVTISVGEAGSETVVMRELTPAKAPAAEPRPMRQRKLPAPPEEPEEPAGPRALGRMRRLVGIGLAGGGVVLTGVGVFFGARARSANRDAESLCAERICENDMDLEKGQDLVDRARSQAALSTALVITGLAAAAAGAVVWITAPRGERVETAVLPIVTDRDLGAAVVGRF